MKNGFCGQPFLSVIFFTARKGFLLGGTYDKRKAEVCRTGSADTE